MSTIGSARQSMSSGVDPVLIKLYEPRENGLLCHLDLINIKNCKYLPTCIELTYKCDFEPYYFFRLWYLQIRKAFSNEFTDDIKKTFII